MVITTIGWWGAYPGAGDATAGFLLESDGTNILLDCGSGVLARLQHHIELQKLDAVVLSHYHWDHVADLGCLQYATRIQMDLGRRTSALKIYGPEDDNFSDLNYLDYTIGYSYRPLKRLRLGPLEFTFCQNIHPDPSFSMRIEKGDSSVVYMTDTGYSDELADFAAGADLLFCESSLYNEYQGKIPGHLTAGEAGCIARVAEVRQLVLTHLPHFGDHRKLVDQARREFNGPVELAANGKCWQL